MYRFIPPVVILAPLDTDVVAGFSIRIRVGGKTSGVGGGGISR